MNATNRPAEATTKKPRAKRYKRRDKKDAQPIRMTPRVIAILELLREHRFLTSKQISQVHESQGGSEDTTRRILRRMYDAGLVDKPEDRLVYRPGKGSEADTYGLGDHGAAYLAERFKLPLPKARMRDKNRDVGPVHIEHSLLSAEVSLAYERACRRPGGVGPRGGPAGRAVWHGWWVRWRFWSARRPRCARPSSRFAGR